MKKKENIIRFKWETQLQYNYRVETGVIISSVGEILGNLEKIQKQNPKEIKIIEELNKLKNKLNNLVVPELYTKIQRHLISCIDSYCSASKKLVDGLKTKDVALTTQSGRLIEKGTCYMKIAKIDIFDIVEIQENRHSKQ